MPSSTIQTDSFKTLFEQAASGSAASLPIPAELRRRAYSRFADQGLPTTRDEQWRFTNLRSLGELPLETAAASRPDITTRHIDPFRFGGISGLRLVFIDGFYQPHLSQLNALPEGVQVGPLHQLPAGLRRQMETQIDRTPGDALSQLNTALVTGGAWVHIRSGIRFDQPIHLMFLGSGGSKPVAASVRNVVFVEAGAQATLIENYASLGDGAGFSNALTQIEIGAEAACEHYLLLRDNEASWNVSTLQVRQETGSRFASHTTLLGGHLVRNNVDVELAGSRSDSLINGLYLPHGRQHMDNHMRVIHAAPHCESRQFYKGILADKASAVFCGRIVVRKGAQKTDAKQTNKNLLLSDEARVDAMPQLEIYADDVKCTHGATTGEMDADALFYLMARGIPASLARSLLIWAFAHEALDRMHCQPLRDKLEEVLLQRLPQGHDLARILDNHEAL